MKVFNLALILARIVYYGEFSLLPFSSFCSVCSDFLWYIVYKIETSANIDFHGFGI